jgi:preprotein translocase subunit SecA
MNIIPTGVGGLSFNQNGGLMDDRTGEIRTLAEVDAMVAEDRSHMHEMKLPLTRSKRRSGKVSRNDPCPCGSGKKFKRCHLLPGRKLP